MTNMPLISVIVPVYKVEPYLRECVDSILNQTFTDFELILVDDGSPDNCPQICDEYVRKDNRVMVIHKENGGLSSARNVGLDYVFAHSDSRYISFVDSDDYIDFDFLKILLESIDYCDICVCSYSTINKNLEGFAVNDKIVDKENYWKLGDDGVYSIVAWNKLYKKELFKNLRYLEGKIHEDEFIIHRLISKCSCIKCIKEKLYYYRYRSESITFEESSVKKNLLLIEILTDRAYFYYHEETNPRLFKYNYDKALTLMMKWHSVYKKIKDYRKCFYRMKKIYKNKSKSKTETLFYYLPSLCLFIKKHIKQT